MLIAVVLNDDTRTPVTISVHEGDDLHEHWTGTVRSSTAPIRGEHVATALTGRATGMKSYVSFHGGEVIGTPFR